MSSKSLSIWMIKIEKISKMNFIAQNVEIQSLKYKTNKKLF